MGFASTASEREENRDEECDNDPEVDAASHFWWLFLQNLWCKKKKKQREESARRVVILVASCRTHLTGYVIIAVLL